MERTGWLCKCADSTDVAAGAPSPKLASIRISVKHWLVRSKQEHWVLLPPPWACSANTLVEPSLLLREVAYWERADVCVMCVRDPEEGRSTLLYPMWGPVAPASPRRASPSNQCLCPVPYVPILTHVASRLQVVRVGPPARRAAAAGRRTPPPQVAAALPPYIQGHAE